MAMATRAAYGKALAKLVQENQDVVVLDADLAGSTKTGDAKAVCPQRHFDMGIAEGNMMGVAAGLAAQRQDRLCLSFAMFAAGRAFEQIRNSICYPNLNVKVCATHAGDHGRRRRGKSSKRRGSGPDAKHSEHEHAI